VGGPGGLSAGSTHRKKAKKGRAERKSSFCGLGGEREKCPRIVRQEETLISIRQPGTAPGDAYKSVGRKGRPVRKRKEKVGGYETGDRRLIPSETIIKKIRKGGGVKEIYDDEKEETIATGALPAIFENSDPGALVNRNGVSVGTNGGLKGDLRWRYVSGSKRRL